MLETSFLVVRLLPFHRNFGKRLIKSPKLDFLLDLGSEPVPVEAKSARTFASDFPDGVNWCRQLAGVSEGPAAVIHGGDRSFRRKGVVALSWADL